MTRKFHTDKIIGEKVERELLNLLKNNVKDYYFVEKVPCVNDGGYPYDLRLTTRDEDGRSRDINIEVKAESGRKIIQWGDRKISEHLNTGCVEVWADVQKKKRPEFFNDDVDIIVFKNRARGKFYFYRAQPVIEYLKNWEGELTYAKNNCEDTNGWIMKFYWSPDEDVHPKFRDERMFLPGFLCERQGIVEDEIREEEL